MAGQKNMHHRRTARKDRAIKLREDRAKRTDQQQLDGLDKMFGKGNGAKKERARLTLKIATTKEKAQMKEAAEVAEVKTKEKTKAKDRRKATKGKK